MPNTIININLLRSGKQFIPNTMLDKNLTNKVLKDRNTKLDIFYNKSISSFSNSN